MIDAAMDKLNLKNILTVIRDTINRSSEAAIRKADNAQAVAEAAQITSEKVYEFVDSRIEEDSVVLKSSTVNSTKKFRISVNDSGAISATEVTQ